MSDEAVIMPFEYHPVLEIRNALSFAVGFVPSHPSIVITDQNDRKFVVACPPAMVLVRMDISDQAKFGSLASAISQTSLETIVQVMIDFRNRPWTLLRGVSLIARGTPPNVQAAYITRLSSVLERGDQCIFASGPALDLSGVIQEQLGRIKKFSNIVGSGMLRDHVEQGIQILREAAERDAKTAMSTLAGETYDFERDASNDNRANIQAMIRSSQLTKNRGDYPVVPSDLVAKWGSSGVMGDDEPDGLTGA